MKRKKMFMMSFILFFVISFAVFYSGLSVLEATEEETRTVEFEPPDVPLPGSTSFKVEGLDPGESVEILIQRPNGVIIQHKSQADSQGIFTGTITVSEQLPTGEYHVLIRGTDSGRSWEGTFTVSAVTEKTAPESSKEDSETTIELASPELETSTSESEAASADYRDKMVEIEARQVEIESEFDKHIGVDFKSLQDKVDSFENLLKTYSGDTKKVGWFKLWWLVGFWSSILWIFPWIFAGWQWTKSKFWKFGWPCWPWWFWIPLFWFVPWVVVGCIWWLEWWLCWTWVWWLFPWVFWAFWWIIVFKEAIVWHWKKNKSIISQ